MNICPICQKEHDGSYGSGKFCSKHCRYVYIGRQNKHPVNNFPKSKKSWGTWKCCWCDQIFETKLKLIEHKKLLHKSPPPWNKGLTKETDERIKKSCDTFHKKFLSGDIKLVGHPHSKETKELLSKMRSDYLASAKNAGGFRDVGWYDVKNIKDEQYTVRGLWEYNVALKLNELKIYWTKNHYLNYFIDNVKKIYNPDFYLPDQNAYIEVKGYFSEKDKIKMDAVLDQNSKVKIYFMKYEAYQNFIQGKIILDQTPIYKILD